MTSPFPLVLLLLLSSCANAQRSETPTTTAAYTASPGADRPHLPGERAGRSFPKAPTGSASMASVATLAATMADLASPVMMEA